jgi:hypothetical protein
VKCIWYKFAKVVVLGIMLVGVLSFLVIPIIVDTMRYREARRRYDSSAVLIDTMRELYNMIILMFVDGAPLPIGEFPAGSLQLRSSDFVPYYNSGHGVENFPIRTSTTIISCDFNTGYIYVGFSNIHLSEKGPSSTENFAKRVNKRGEFYSDVHGTPYAGQDTILMRTVNFRKRYDGWGEITKAAYRLRDMVRLIYTDGVLPPIGEFPPGGLQSMSSDLEPYYGLSGLSDLDINYCPIIKTSTTITSYDFQTGDAYVGFSGINVEKYHPNRTKSIIESGEFYSDVRGVPYAGGDTALLRAVNLRSEDILILQSSAK